MLSLYISPSGDIFCSKLKNSHAVFVMAPCFWIIPWSSAVIPLCFKEEEFNFKVKEPEMESPLKKVGYLSDVLLRSVNLWRWRPRISLNLIVQFGFFKILEIYYKYVILYKLKYYFFHFLILIIYFIFDFS